jgi:hypothetical protein
VSDKVRLACRVTCTGCHRKRSFIQLSRLAPKPQILRFIRPPCDEITSERRAPTTGYDRQLYGIRPRQSQRAHAQAHATFTTAPLTHTKVVGLTLRASRARLHLARSLDALAHGGYLTITRRDIPFAFSSRRARHTAIQHHARQSTPRSPQHSPILCIGSAFELSAPSHPCFRYLTLNYTR